jgi:hypothetical protein
MKQKDLDSLIELHDKMLRQVEVMTFTSQEFEGQLNDSILRILNIIVEFRELQKKLDRVSTEDDEMDTKLQEIVKDLKRLQDLQRNHFKYVIGAIGKRSSQVQSSDYLKDVFNRLDFNFYSSQ